MSREKKQLYDANAVSAERWARRINDKWQSGAAAFVKTISKTEDHSGIAVEGI